jgi:hypothetical protein
LLSLSGKEIYCWWYWHRRFFVLFLFGRQPSECCVSFWVYLWVRVNDDIVCWCQISLLNA